jgi:hypothetical protein
MIQYFKIDPEIHDVIVKLGGHFDTYVLAFVIGSSKLEEARAAFTNLGHIVEYFDRTVYITDSD